MKKVSIGLLALGLVKFVGLSASVIGEGKIVTDNDIYTCAGGDNSSTVCNFTFNAVGDLVSITPNVAPMKLGNITVVQRHDVTMPAVGGQKLFTLTTTVPHSMDSMMDKMLVGNQMEVLFVSDFPNAEALKLNSNARSMVKVYRRMSGETLWTEMATILSEYMPEEITGRITVNPNGDMQWTNAKGEVQTIHFGQAVIG